MSWRLKRTTQCAKCPWRTSTNPHEIPNGYDPKKHAALSGTIAKEGDWSVLVSALASVELRCMACHESHDAHCLGWLMHQIGPGNNIALRLHMTSCENLGEVELRGPQHKRFEDTLPSP